MVVVWSSSGRCLLVWCRLVLWSLSVLSSPCLVLVVWCRLVVIWCCQSTLRILVLCGRNCGDGAQSLGTGKDTPTTLMFRIVGKFGVYQMAARKEAQAKQDIPLQRKSMTTGLQLFHIGAQLAQGSKHSCRIGSRQKYSLDPPPPCFADCKKLVFYVLWQRPAF